MTLIGAILNRAKGSSTRKYTSPPPEIDKSNLIRKHKKRIYKYRKVKAIVDSSPPSYHAQCLLRFLPEWGRRTKDLYLDNARILFAITTAYMNGGRVDSHWSKDVIRTKQYYENRVLFYKNIMRDNIELYKRIQNAIPRVATTKYLERDWERKKVEMTQLARTKFVLFPVSPIVIEDSAFEPPGGVKRPRVYINLRARGGSALGCLRVELFTEVCPNTCGLFLELMKGDGVGHGYVGTKFFRKVPHLFWSGGDVIYDAGLGCYAQRGRRMPIGAENYHFPHSMPGLLSMQVTCDDEMCGIFNITFKPIAQFDLRNVVFGRIIRPCSTFEAIQTLSSSPHPAIEISSAKLKFNDRWVYGTRNTRIRSVTPMHIQRPNKL